MNKKGSSIPVFSVKKCTNPNAVKDQSFAFSATDFMTESEHGDFELSTGIFSVKTPGVYQFQFTGHVLSTLILNQDIAVSNSRFELRVDGIMKAISYFSSGLTMSSSNSRYGANTVTFSSTVSRRSHCSPFIEIWRKSWRLPYFGHHSRSRTCVCYPIFRHSRFSLNESTPQLPWKR